MKNVFKILLCILVSCNTSLAQGKLAAKQAGNREIVLELNKKWENLAETDENVIFLPGLKADKKEQNVIFLAEATDIGIGDLVEFFVIGSASGHDYEALARSFATAGDIKKGLEFIGMSPGSSVDFRNNRFWPKGERVRMYIAHNSELEKLVPVEKYVLDDRTGETLPEVGLTFTGSAMIENRDNEMVLAADAREPQSIASNYNEPETLLDIPYQGNQDVLYDHLHTHKSQRLPTNELLRIVLEPEHKDGTKRVCDLALDVKAPETADVSISNYIFTVTGPEGELLNETKDLQSAVELFAEKNKADKDVFVSLSFCDNMPAAKAAQVCRLIRPMEASGSLRLEPPAEGQLYYRAFIPNPAHLDRKARAGHPWELRLKAENEKVTGKITYCEFIWTKNAQNPEIKATDFDVDSPDAARQIIETVNEKRKAADKQPNIPVMLVVAPPDMTVGNILSFVMPLQDITPIIHIYSGE